MMGTIYKINKITIQYKSNYYIFNFIFIRAASEVRSYDETTVQPTTKSLRSLYDSKSQNMNDV